MEELIIQVLKVIGWIFGIMFVTVSLWIFWSWYDIARIIEDELEWLFRSS